MSEHTPHLGRKITTVAVGALIALASHAAEVSAEGTEIPVTTDGVSTISGEVAFLCKSDLNGDGIVDPYEGITIYVSVTPESPEAQNPCPSIDPVSAPTSEQVAVADPPVPTTPETSIATQISPELPVTGDNVLKLTGFAATSTALGLLGIALARRPEEA